MQLLLRPAVVLLLALQARASGGTWSGASGGASGGPGPVYDPVPRVEKEDVTVGVRVVAAFPRLADAQGAAYANDAFARIQNLVPARDGSRDMFVNDLRGVIYRVHRADGEALGQVTPYLDLRDAGLGFSNVFHGNESGLSGFAFHPDFARKGRPGYGRLYVAFSAPRGSGVLDYPGDGNASHESVIMEWAAGDPTAQKFEGTHREVLRVGQPGDTHNVGTLAFNPTAAPGNADYGLLYASFGDGKGQYDPLRSAQRRPNPLGKILRLNPLSGPQGQRHTPPADNPFLAEPEAGPIVYCYGLRHPQHFSWDLGGSHRMFIAEMGQDEVEEVDVGVAGGNYGWSDREGTFSTGMALGLAPGPVYPRPAQDAANSLDPVAQYDHGDGKALGSVIVYRGKAIPELQGQLLTADIVNGRIFYAPEGALQQGSQVPLKSLRLSFDGSERELQSVTHHSGGRVDLRLGQDAEGEVYLLCKSDGKLRQLIPIKR